jgi:hypothetical protein
VTLLRCQRADAHRAGSSAAVPSTRRQNILEFIRQRPAYKFAYTFFDGAKYSEVLLGSAQTDIFVWAAPDFACFRFILSVIVPKANFAYFVLASAMKGFEFAAWASILFVRAWEILIGMHYPRHPRSARSLVLGQ